MSKYLHSILFLFLFALTNVYSQSIDLDDLPDVEDYTVLRTNEEADTVVLVLHGGPSPQLSPGAFYRFESVPTFSVVEVMKSEMLSEIMEKPNLTYVECIATNDTTAALIQKTVLHYKALDKFVVLVGHSWGAIIMGEYLDDYGNEDVDKIIPMCGRISAPLDFVEYLKDGFLPYFSNGVDVTVDLTNPYPLPNIILLGAAAFENRWIDSLDQLDLSNLLYAHAEFDQSTGQLLPEEVEFLEASNAQVLFLEGGDHGTVFDFGPHQIIFDFIRASNPMVSVVDVNQVALSLYPSVTNSKIHLNTESDGALMVFNISGAQVENRIIQEGQSMVNVDHYNSGHYFALFRSETGQMSKARFQVVN